MAGFDCMRLPRPKPTDIFMKKSPAAFPARKGRLFLKPMLCPDARCAMFAGPGVAVIDIMKRLSGTDIIVVSFICVIVVFILVVIVWIL